MDRDGISSLKNFNPSEFRYVHKKKNSDVNVDLYDIESLTIKCDSGNNKTDEKKKMLKENNKLTKLKQLSQCPKDELDRLLVEKLRSVTSPMLKEEIKRSTLEELLKFVRGQDQEPFPLTAYPDMVNMFSKNVFRILPPSNLPDNEFDSDEDENVEYLNDSEWTLLEMNYKLFLAFLESPKFDLNLSKRYIKQNFIINLLSLFDNSNPLERMWLKITLHKIYSIYLSLRAYIRKQINYIFQTFIYETERHNGIAELLEVEGSIIDGFTVPLKTEHKIFLLRTLIPLHKPSNLSCYHEQVVYCVCQLLGKDSTLTESVVKGLLKFWPRRNSKKIILFLDELSEILSSPKNQEELKDSKIPLLKELFNSASSRHFQVSEKALTLIISLNDTGMITKRDLIHAPKSVLEIM